MLSERKSDIIQTLRGAAIIAVVFIHNTPSRLPQVFIRPFLNFAVGLFLFISGMLSSSDRWKPWKRIKKVAVPYLIWTMIYVLLKNFETPSLIPKSFVVNLLTGKSAAMMYYVFVYIELTLLIPLIDKLARSRFKLIGFIISPLEIIIMRLIPLIAGYEMNKYVAAVMSLSCLGWFSYFYLGYLLGNGLLKINVSKPKLYVMLAIAFLLQIAEGYWYYSMGSQNCGTQLKLSSVLTGCVLMILIFDFIGSERHGGNRPLHLLGDCSFGIYFSHMAFMLILSMIPWYSEYVFYPLNAIIILLISCCFVLIGKRLLGKFGRYLAF
ncbi:MAG: acyltransferase [Clostridia bacterium]|nr:acyltransferase [Clostridia bacterium]